MNGLEQNKARKPRRFQEKMLGLFFLFLGCVASFSTAMALETDGGSSAPAALDSSPDKGEGEKDAKTSESTSVKVVHGEQKSLTLGMGTSQTLEFPFDLGPIAVTDPTLFTYTRIVEGDRARKLLLTPKRPGSTDFTIYDPNGAPKITYQILVTREDVGELMSQLKSLLGDIEGLDIKAVGGTIVLDGEIVLPKDELRIFRVLDALRDRDTKAKEVPIKNLTSISKMTMNIIAEQIEQKIGSPEITARVLNNTIILEGTAEGPFEAERAQEIAKSFIPEVFIEKNSGEGGKIQPLKYGGNGGGLPVVVDLVRVREAPATPPAQDVKITMNFVQFDNQYDRTFNFNWQPLMSDNTALQYNSSLGQLSANLVSTVSSLFPKLNIVKDHGHARILKQETVVVKNNAAEPAAIDNSTTYYVQINTPQGFSSMQPINIQNVTKIKASTIPGSDSIELGIQITLGALLGSNNGFPIVGNNSLQTVVTVKNGDSAALGGYGVEQALAGFNRAPSLLNSNPAAQGSAGGNAGPLFNMNRSKQYQHDRQQYVIFITPEIIRTAAAGTEDITRKFRLNQGE